VLQPNHFAAFKSINEIVLYQSISQSTSVLHKWSRHAFDGVEVKRLSVYNLAGLFGDTLAPALQVLAGSLEFLRVNSPGDRIELAKDVFKGFSNLQELIINQATITYVYNQAFSGLEHSLNTLRLNSAGLTALPSGALIKLESLTYLDLSRNQIETLGNNTFQNAPNLVTIHLDSNPLDTIENGVFRGLSNLREVSLANTQLSKLDLTLFADMNSENDSRISCDSCQYLDGITVSASDKFPALAKLSFTSAALSTIDAKVGDLLTKYPNIRLDITHTSNLNCDKLTWMAKIVQCTDSIITDSTTVCSDEGIPLRKYLEQLTPQPACD